MFRTLVLLLSLAIAASAKTPRALASVPIHLRGGKSIDITKEYKGKVVLLVLMSTECESCLAALQFVDGIQKEFEGRNFQAIAVACEPDSDKAIGPFIDRYRPKIPMGYYNKDEMFKAADYLDGYRPFVPVFVFIDKKGVVRFQYEGNDKYFNPDRVKLTHLISTGLMNENTGKGDENTGKGK